MKPPIFIDNNGDIGVFTSVQDAENWIEPIDVKNNEYEAFDSEGRLLRMTVEKRIGFLNCGSEYVRITETETYPAHAAYLCLKLQRFLKAAGEHDIDSATSLRELVNATSRYAKR